MYDKGKQGLLVPRGTLTSNTVFDDLFRKIHDDTMLNSSFLASVSLVEGLLNIAPDQDIEIDALANEACTSPLNDLPLPTDEQKETGDYKKGIIKLSGLEIYIENPAGSIRKGDTWEVVLKHHYGFFAFSKGADGDEVDVFIKAGIKRFTDKVFIIKQVDQNGVFDEHKVVLGASSIDEAKDIYLSNYTAGWNGFGDIQEVSLLELRNKLLKTWSEFDDAGFSSEFSKQKITQHNAVSFLKYMIENANQILSDNPNDINYRWKDQGYVAGSKKELAKLIKDAKANGDIVTINSIDWKAIKSDPRFGEVILLKSNLIGKIDWLSFKDEGMDSNVAYFIKKFYQQIATQPLAPLNFNSQQNYVNIISNIRQGLEKIKTYDQLQDYVLEVWSMLKRLPPKILNLYYSNDSDKKIAEKYPAIKEYPLRVSAELGEKLYTWLIKNGSTALFEAKTGTNVKTATESKGNTWQWAEPKNKKDGEAKPQKRKTTFQLQVADKIERIGGKEIDITSSSDLKALIGLNAVQSGNWVLKDKGSAEFHMTQTAQAMSDMSDVLNIPIHQLGLGGNLSIAFGARGKGGASAHYEPDERIVNITKFKGGGSLGHELFHAIDNLIQTLSTQKIGSTQFMGTENFDQLENLELKDAFKNLVEQMTTKKGFKSNISDRLFKIKQDYFNSEKSVFVAGRDIDSTLAHDELIKQIDSAFIEYQKKFKTTPIIEIQNSQFGALNSLALARYFHGIKDLYNEETKTVSIASQVLIRESNFSKHALNLDGDRRNKYWSSFPELSARAFTSYLIDRLAEQGRKNTYLAFEGGDDALAFPQGNERKEINKAFDKLFKVIVDQKIFENAVQNQALMDDIFSHRNNDHIADLNTISKADEDNKLLVLRSMYAIFLSKEIQLINNSDDPFVIDSADETIHEFAKKFSMGEVEINAESLLKIENSALELTKEELSAVIAVIEDSLSKNLVFDNSKKLFEMAKSKTDVDKISLYLACNVYESTIVEHTTRKGKTLHGIALMYVSYAEAKNLDEYTFRKNGGYFIREKNILSCDDNFLTENQIIAKQVLAYVSSDDGLTQTTSAVRGRASRSKASMADGRGATTTTGEATQGADGKRSNRDSGNGISALLSPSVAGSSDSRNEQNGDSGEDSAIDGRRSDTTSSTRSPIERKRSESAFKLADATRTELSRRIELQNNASLEHKQWASLEDIEKAVPILLKEQQNDVLSIEKRLFVDNKNGMLVTNGTGTGKTFVALGVVKRLLNSGMKNILICVMNDKILKDFVKSGKALGLDIHALQNTQDNGEKHKVVIGTYHNIGANSSLYQRQWEAVIADEAHMLMQSAEGKPTNALKALRAHTGHHDGFDTWLSGKYGDDLSLKELTHLTEQHQPEWRNRWKEQKNLPKVIFLSATPFAYVKCIDWAEGYLFNFTPPANQYDERESYSYNSASPRARFFIEKFGFRMRYNKLTMPDNNVDIGTSERDFNDDLKESGALIGRKIQVKYDYDRKFVLIDSTLGNLLDEGFSYLSTAKKEDGSTKRYVDLSTFLSKAFTYIKRRQLLEAIKAQCSIDYIKKHHALGRKVVVFHDYNEGGDFNPFRLPPLPDNRNSENLLEEYEDFKKQRPDLVNLAIRYSSSTNTFKTSFPKALFFSGRVSKKQRQENVDLFNTDNSGFDILIVQSDAGSTGISLHDTTGVHQRVCINIGQPTQPAKFRQIEGRTFRVGLASNAIYRNLTTGTDWERSAFADTIAGRAETVDNLALGSMAKASIKEAIIEAYDDADYDEPSVNDGVGGKEQDRNRERDLSLTPFQKSLNFYYKKQKTTTNRQNREGKDWFATPEPLGMKMVEWSGAHRGDKVLEPSAGDGALMRFAPDGIDLKMIEQSESLASRALMANTSANVEVGDFLKEHDTHNKYHSIVMNPPFGHGGSDAIRHLKKAFQHLYDNGRIVALVPRGTMDKKLDDWLNEETNANLVTQVLLPACTFEKAGTAVLTQVLIIDKLARDKDEVEAVSPIGMIDHNNIETLDDLFNTIEQQAVPNRLPRLDEQLSSYGLYIDPYKHDYLISGIGLENAKTKEIISAVSYTKNNVDGLIQYSNNGKKIVKKLQEYERESNISLKAE